MPVSEGQCENWGQAARTYDAEYRSTVGEAFENEIRTWLARQFTDTDKALELRLRNRNLFGNDRRASQVPDGHGFQRGNAGAGDAVPGRIRQR